MRRHELSDEEWSIIQPLLPSKPRGVPRVDDRRVLNGILWRLRTGAPWRDIPERYGPRTTLYNRFVRWRAAGVWDRILAAVSAAYDGDIVMIDSSCVRVHQHGAAIKRGSRRRGWWHGTLPGRANHQDPRAGRCRRPSGEAHADAGPGGRCPGCSELARRPRPRRDAHRRPGLRHQRHPRSRRERGAWPTSRLARSARAASPSPAGSTASETWSSASSTGSNSSAASPPATTENPRTSAPRFSLPPSASGLQLNESAP